MSDKGLVSSELILMIRKSSGSKNLDAMIAELAAVEPALTESICKSMKSAMKMLDVYGLPADVLRALHDLMSAVAIQSAQAMRHGVYLRWKEGGDNLAELGPDLVKRYGDIPNRIEGGESGKPKE